MFNQFISPDKIRLFLLDRCAQDNFLLDDVDFPDELLDLAQELVVDRYKTTSPFVGPVYTVETFPYKMEFLLGVAAMVLRTKAINLKRNQLNYTAAEGTAVDDKRRADDYLALANQFQLEFDQRCKSIKAHLNIEEGYGFQGSDYANWV